MNFKITEPAKVDRKPFDLTLELRTEEDVYQLNEMLKVAPGLRQDVLKKVQEITGKAA
jgi:hypothetical protein